MALNFLAENPMLFVVWIIAILIALSVHEFSHALVGTALGDDTAKRMGRLTLNPFAHVDPIGLIMLLVVGFGWGKPVPFNPYNLRYPRFGPTLVALAGPFANLVSMVVFGIALKLITVFTALSISNLLIQFLGLLVMLNLGLLLFNLIPIPPLDGSKLLLAALASPRYARIRHLLETRGPLLLLALIILDNLFGLNIFGFLFSRIITLVYRFF